MCHTYRKASVIVGFVLCLFSSVFAYSGGTGDPNSPYQIGSVSDWQELISTTADWNKHFIMIADVNLQGVSLTPVGNYENNFTGVFNGNDHVISHVVISQSSGFVGLFGYLNGGQIKNLSVEDANIISKGVAGGLVGYCRSDSIISNCRSKGSVSASSISPSTYTTSYAGGLVGYLYSGTIFNSYSTCSVSSSSSSPCAGGLVGTQKYGIISNSYSTGSVSSSSLSSFSIAYAGGLVGLSYGTISNCYSKGSVSLSSISSSTDTYSYAGGLIGLSSAAISNCYSTGSVSLSSSSYSSAGGLVGYKFDGNISKCYSTGSVSGSENVGGLVGYNDGGSVSNCYSTSSASGSDNIGGLVGWNDYGSISNCYSTGLVSGSENVGGLVGWNYDSSITNCYSTGAVSGSSYVGGLVGYNNGGSIIVSSLWDMDTSGQTTSQGGIGKTSDQMKTRITFTSYDWDFSYTDGDDIDWFIQIDEYPILVWQISPADIYTDGKNNFRDFAFFAQYWMRDNCAIYNNYCNWTDLDFNGSVDINDLFVLMSYWLQSGVYE